MPALRESGVSVRALHFRAILEPKEQVYFSVSGEVAEDMGEARARNLILRAHMDRVDRETGQAHVVVEVGLLTDGVYIAQEL